MPIFELRNEPCSTTGKGIVQKWHSVLRLQDPQDARNLLGPHGPLGTLWDSENLPGTSGIPRNVMLEKDFLGIITRFLYLRNYNFSTRKISHFYTVCSWATIC